MRLRNAIAIVVCASALVCGALAASATAGEFEIEGSEPVTVLGAQVGETAAVFDFEGVQVECEKVEFSGAMEIAQTTLQVAPKYSGCLGFGGAETTISMGGCEYEFLEPSGGESSTGQFSIVCPEEGAITVAGLTCEVEIGAQGPVEGLTYKDQETTPASLRVEASLAGLAYTKTKDGFLCPLNETGSKEDGKYTGSADFQGNQEEEAVAFGLSFAWMESNPAEVAFPGEVEIGKSAKQNLSFTFIGPVRKSIKIQTVRVVNTAGTPFKAVNNGCTKGTLNKGTPCKLEVEFTPEKKGEVTGKAIIEEDRLAPRVYEVQVKGTGK